MRKIRDVLRLRVQGELSHRQIARSLGLGRTTVAEYLRRAGKAGVGWPLPADLEEGALERLLFPEAVPIHVRPQPQPDWALIHQELRRPAVTLFLLWQEYRAVHPEGYQYSRFCDLHRHFASKLNPSMRQIHCAGEKIFVDFSGLRPHYVDPKTGEVIEVELFVGALGASGYTYAEAVASQELPCWIGVHQRMFVFFEGCSAILVPASPITWYFWLFVLPVFASSRASAIPTWYWPWVAEIDVVSRRKVESVAEKIIKLQP